MDSLQRMDRYTQSASVNRHQADLLREASEARTMRALRHTEADETVRTPAVRAALGAFRGRLAHLISPAAQHGHVVVRHGMVPRPPSHPTAFKA